MTVWAVWLNPVVWVRKVIYWTRQLRPALGANVMRLLFFVGRHSPSLHRAGLARAANRLALDTDKPCPHEVVFIGSSTFRNWGAGLAKAMLPEVYAINRGFGGSRSEDVIAAMDDLVVRHQPRLVVCYFGVNDVHFGAGASEVLAGMQKFHAQLRAKLPESTQVLVLAMNRAPLHDRLGLRDTIERGNDLLADWCAEQPNTTFFDPFGPHRRFSNDLSIYRYDLLHFTDQGYKLFAQAIKRKVVEIAGNKKETAKA